MPTIALKSDGQEAVNQFHAYFEDVFRRIPRSERARFAAKKLGYSFAAMNRYLSDAAEPPMVLTRLLWHESIYAECEIESYKHWVLMNNEQLRMLQAEEIKRLRSKITALEADIDELKQHVSRGAPRRLIAANASSYSAF